MDDQLYKSLKYVAIVLVLGFIGFSIYDGLINGKDAYTLSMGAGHRYFEDGQYVDAITEFKAVLEVKPNDPPANYGIAISQMQLGSNDLALKYFALAIEAWRAPTASETRRFTSTPCRAVSASARAARSPCQIAKLAHTRSDKATTPPTPKAVRFRRASFRNR